MSKTEARKNLRRERIGVVIKDKMQKTIVVQTRERALHPLYGKVVRKGVRFKAHDEKNQAKVGDLVRVAETRPLSKDKRWRVVEVLSHQEGKGSSSDLKEVEAVQRTKTPPPAPSASAKVEGAAQ